MKTSVIFTWALLVTFQACFVMTCPPEIQFDVVYSVDTGPSTGAHNYHHFFDLIKNITSRFNVGDEAIRVGLVVYDLEHQYTYFKLTGDVNLFYAKLAQMKYRSNQPQTSTCLKASKQMFSDPYERTPKVSQIVFFATDTTNSRKPNVGIGTAELLKEVGMIIFTVGKVPGANENELMQIATKPENSFIFTGYEAMAESAEEIAAMICEAAIEAKSQTV